MDLAISLLDRMRTEGFSEELITSGKNYILGQFPPRVETSTQLARQFATLQAVGLGPSYINDYGMAVAEASGEDIQAVISAVYPNPDNLIFVVIGDAGVRVRIGFGTRLGVGDDRVGGAFAAVS